MPRRAMPPPTCFVPSCPADFVGQAGKVAEVLMRKRSGRRWRTPAIRFHAEFAGALRWIARRHRSSQLGAWKCGGTSVFHFCPCTQTSGL